MRFDAIITGTGRCGTGYVSKLLTQAGMNCGHELFFTTNGVKNTDHWLGTKADSSWMAAPFLRRFCKSKIIHLIRHPQKVIESLLRIKFFDNPLTIDYMNFVRPYLPDFDDVNKAAYFYVIWNRLIEESGCVDFVFKIEDDPTKLLNFLSLPTDNIFGNKKYNHKSGYVLSKSFSPDDLLPEIREELLIISDEYDYKNDYHYIR